MVVVVTKPKGQREGFGNGLYKLLKVVRRDNSISCSSGGIPFAVVVVVVVVVVVGGYRW